MSVEKFDRALWKDYNKAMERIRELEARLADRDLVLQDLREVFDATEARLAEAERHLAHLSNEVTDHGPLPSCCYEFLFKARDGRDSGDVRVRGSAEASDHSPSAAANPARASYEEHRHVVVQTDEGARCHLCGERGGLRSDTGLHLRVPLRPKGV